MSDDAVAADVRPSPLHDEHVALGATLVPFAGWSMPLRYGSDLAEHTAVRTAAGLFDLSHMAEIAVLGPDAGAFLDHALVGSFSAMARRPGALHDDLRGVRRGARRPDRLPHRRRARYLVVANAANHDPVLAALRERVGDLDVSVEDRTDTTALIAVQGPRALEILQATPGLVAEGLAELRYYAALEGTFDVDGEARPVLVARTGYTGEDGFELFVDADTVGVPLWRALLAAGEPFGLVPAGLAARDSLRLEAGMPLYGHELDLTVTPYAAGLGRVVKLDKTDADGAPLDFVGRAALYARAHSAPARVLVGLVGESRRAARQGYDVTTRGGTHVGHVTSGAPSPTLGVPIAMAYVTPEASAEGTELAVDVRGRLEPVHVVPLPFYRRP